MKTDGITVKRLHWWAAWPWRAQFLFAFSRDGGEQEGSGLHFVSVVARTPYEAIQRAAVLRCAMITMRDKGQL